MSFSRKDFGTPLTHNYEAYASRGGAIVSFWHDIPLFPDANKPLLLNMVVEIPRWSNAKYEISKSREFNPIVQYVKGQSLRYVNNIFPFKGYLWNYGAFPQTWIDPAEICAHTCMPGDDDPLDVLEIGSNVLGVGDVVQVKVIGVLGMIDQNQCDWKVVAINVEDPLAESINSPEDIDVYMPGLSALTHQWLRVYKIPTGRGANEFLFDGKILPPDFAHQVVKESHESWKKLITGGIESRHSLVNASLNNEKSKVFDEEARPKPVNVSNSQTSVAETWCFMELHKSFK